MWSKIWNWITGAVKSLFKIVMKGAKQGVTDFMNDPEVQQAAKDAIITVKNQGYTDNEALDSAVEILKEKGIASGLSCVNTILRTLVQNAYCAIKCSEENN